MQFLLVYMEAGGFIYSECPSSILAVDKSSVWVPGVHLCYPKRQIPISHYPGEDVSSVYKSNKVLFIIHIATFWLQWCIDFDHSYILKTLYNVYMIYHSKPHPSISCPHHGMATSDPTKLICVQEREIHLCYNII